MIINFDKSVLQARQIKLIQMQSLPLIAKIEASKRRIREWYEYYEGNVSISLSGKDSRVLLDLVRSMYPEVPAYFADTGLEYPEIKKFIQSIDNVIIVKPKITFLQVINQYGYPVVSKTISQYVEEIRRTKSPNCIKLRLFGIRRDGSFSPMAKIAKKWHFLKDAPFKISDRCCDKLKKEPLYCMPNPFIGILAEEGRQRQMSYRMYGCNRFDEKKTRSWPLVFWTSKDIWEYIKQNNLSYPKIYDMGTERTGCMFCLFGLHLEGRPNRLDRLRLTHPQIYNWCMDGSLNLREIIKYVYGEKIISPGFFKDNKDLILKSRR